MLELLMGYILIGIAVLIPLLLLAGVAWVLIHPLSPEEVDGQPGESTQSADAERVSESLDSRPAGPRGPGQAA